MTTNEQKIEMATLVLLTPENYRAFWDAAQKEYTENLREMVRFSYKLALIKDPNDKVVMSDPEGNLVKFVKGRDAFVNAWAWLRLEEKKWAFDLKEIKYIGAMGSNGEILASVGTYAFDQTLGKQYPGLWGGFVLGAATNPELLVKLLAQQVAEAQQAGYRKLSYGIPLSGNSEAAEQLLLNNGFLRTQLAPAQQTKGYKDYVLVQTINMQPKPREELAVQTPTALKTGFRL